MNVKAYLGAAASAAVLLVASHAAAADATAYKPEGKGTLVIDLRITDVVPSANDTIFTAAGADSGLKVQVSDAIMPTLGFKYFVTDQISLEAILGMTQHDIFAVGSDGATKAHSTWVLPPVVTVQYHPFPKARISPYVGAGANLMVYFAGTDYNGLTVGLQDKFGYAFQAGADIALTGPWVINLDAKKVFTETTANIDSGALYSHVHLDPWVVSLGLGRKF